VSSCGACFEPKCPYIDHEFGARQDAIDPVARVAIARPGALNAAVTAAAELAALTECWRDARA
jgi:hypothetical protein